METITMLTNGKFVKKTVVKNAGEHIKDPKSGKQK